MDALMGNVQKILKFSNEVDGMKDNLSLSVGNTIEFGYKIIHNYPLLAINRTYK